MPAMPAHHLESMWRMMRCCTEATATPSSFPKGPENGTSATAACRMEWKAVLERSSSLIASVSPGDGNLQEGQGK